MLQKMFGDASAAYNEADLTKVREALLKKHGQHVMDAIRGKIAAKADEHGAFPLNDLYVDEEAQRHSGDTDQQLAIRAVKNWVETFDINAFEVCSIGKRKGNKCILVDGGHRALFARLMGAEAIPGDQWSSPGLAYEAKVFSIMNNKRRGVNSTIRNRVIGTADPDSYEAKLTQAIINASLTPTTEDFKGTSSLLSTLKEIDKGEYTTEEAIDAITEGLTVFQEIWPEAIIDQDVASALAICWVRGDLADAQPEYAQDIAAQWPLPKDLKEWSKPMISTAHAHGSGRRNAIVAAIKTVLKVEEDSQEPDDELDELTMDVLAALDPTKGQAADEIADEVGDVLGSIVGVLKYLESLGKAAKDRKNLWRRVEA